MAVTATMVAVKPAPEAMGICPTGPEGKMPSAAVEMTMIMGKSSGGTSPLITVIARSQAPPLTVIGTSALPMTWSAPKPLSWLTASGSTVIPPAVVTLSTLVPSTKEAGASVSQLMVRS